MSSPHRLPVWTYMALGVIVVWAWQWATVTANYGGNWTALYCTGALQRQPPSLASEHIYLFPDSAGYDGQFYHYVAHDPFLRHDLKAYLDDPRVRYRRILVPLLAYGLAAGQSGRVDGAYELVFLLSIAAGVYWSCRWAQQAGLTMAWGWLFLLMPAIPIAMDRLVVDAALAALTAGFLYYTRAPSWKLFLVLAGAVLTRETGCLLILAYCAHQLWRRDFRKAGIFLLSAVPAVVWYGYVQVRATGRPVELSFIPLSGIWYVLKNPWQYSPGTPFANVVRMADYVALAGVLLGFTLALLLYVRKPSDPLRIAGMLFACLGLVVGSVLNPAVPRTDQWQNVYHYGRVYTPQLLCLAAIAGWQRKPWLLAPLAMMMPRLSMELAPQVLGVISWMT